MSPNINHEWKCLKDVLIKAAREALGTRKKKLHKRGLVIWNEDIARKIQDKKEAYLKYLNERTDNNLINYKRLSAVAKKKSGN